jgi:hypothetical protein
VKEALNDAKVQLLRDDDTIVETFRMSQLQRVVMGAKTPTLKRAVALGGGLPKKKGGGGSGDGGDKEDDDANNAAPHKWQKISSVGVEESKCLTVIYGNQYLDFEVTDELVEPSSLGKWLVWVTVLASMNSPLPEPDDTAFGGTVGDYGEEGMAAALMAGGISTTSSSPPTSPSSPSSPSSSRSRRRGSMGVVEAVGPPMLAGLTEEGSSSGSSDCGQQQRYGFVCAPEYGDLPGAPVERVNVVSDGMVSPSTPWPAEGVGLLM